MRYRLMFAAVAAGILLGSPLAGQGGGTLTGTWTLVAADQIRADGTRVADYGASPKGLLMIDAEGHYSVQIYAVERPKFRSGRKQTGTPAELAAAVVGSSAHFGTLAVDESARVITLRVESASFPNQDGSLERRPYELHGDTLSYRVPPRPDGTVPVSVWRRLR